MRVVTLNVNGIRSAARRGLYRWLAAQKADVVCLQEIKAQDSDLDAALRAPKGLHGYFYPARKKGYAGVGLYSRVPPEGVRQGFGVKEFDAEGRYL
ncbi:MAG: endonuclease/exonuclease/phosphatase family protein, partial [Burkholderiales bacterium]